MTWKTTNTAKGDNKLYSDAKGIVPSLDLRFAESKTLNDHITGQNLITFSRPDATTCATYVDSNGIIQTAAANVPRFDHDPATGESLGLLIEESRTNYVNNSTTLSPLTFTAGTGVAPQVGTVTTVGPDGVSASITRWQFDRGTGNTIGDYSLVDFGPTTPSANYSQSVWLKSNDTNNYVVIMYDAGGTKGNEFTVTPEWQRFTLDASTSYKNSNDRANTSPDISIGLRNDPSSVGYFTGNTNSQTADILVWGPQIENGTFPTSYIPTSGTTVTRAADVASITGSNFTSFYNQSAGTLYTTGKFYNLNSFAFQVETDSYGFSLGKDNGSTFRLRAQQFSSLSDTSRAFTTNQVKLAVAGVVNNAASAFNGIISATSTDNPSITVQSTALSIGARIGGLGQYSGHISRLTYFPERLPDATLQAITS